MPEKATSSFAEASIKIKVLRILSNLIDVYLDDLNSNSSTELQQFHSYFRHKCSATKAEKARYSHAE